MAAPSPEPPLEAFEGLTEDVTTHPNQFHMASSCEADLESRQSLFIEGGPNEHAALSFNDMNPLLNMPLLPTPEEVFAALGKREREEDAISQGSSKRSAVETPNPEEGISEDLNAPEERAEVTPSETEEIPSKYFEVTRSFGSHFKKSQDMNPSNAAIFTELLSIVREEESEGPVYGAGAMIDKLSHPAEQVFFYKVIELKETVSCSLCPKLFRDQKSLSAHLKRAHESQAEARFKCSNCSEGFKSNANLRRHISLAHSEEGRQYDCEECSAWFSCWLPYVSHRQNQHGIGPKSRSRPRQQVTNGAHSGKEQPKLLSWKCCTCSKKLSNKRNFYRHVNLVHLKHRRFKCDLCPFAAFGTEHNLQCHKSSLHPKASDS